MANKFLNETELTYIKEVIKMSPLGTLIYNDGLSDGISQTAINNARQFLINGVSYELVRKSIKEISDEKLKEIYEEVKGVIAQ